MIIERRLAEAFGIDPAANAVESDGVWSSWGDVKGLTDRIVAKLDAVSAPRGARVGVLLRNRTPELCALLACLMSERCVVAFNPVLPPARLGEDIETQSPALLVGGADVLAQDAVADAAARLGIALLQLPAAVDGDALWLGGASPTPRPGGETKPDVLIEMLTSGTTGPPKRVALGRRNLDEGFLEGLGYETRKRPWPALRRGVRIVSAPLTHISGVFAAVATLADGRPLALLERFSVERWVAMVERHGAMVGNLPPTALRMILDAEVPRERLRSLVALRSGTAPLDPAIIDAFGERYGLPVLGQYGATEFSGAVAGWTIGDFRAWYVAKRGSVGRMQANIDARTIDPDTGETLAIGEPGTLELRGKQLGDGEGWIRTTDRASLDAEGFLWIHGRTDNAINRGGFKILPDDVARAIEEHPLVKEAVVVGIPDSRLGQVPVAAITLRSDETPLRMDDLKAFLMGRLLPYQVPAQFKVVADFPCTPLFKPSTPEIQRLF